MGNVGPLIVTVIGGLIGLALVSVLVSQRAQAPQVIGASGSALAQVIGAAVSPITGASGNTFGSAGAGQGVTIA